VVRRFAAVWPGVDPPVGHAGLDPAGPVPALPDPPESVPAASEPAGAWPDPSGPVPAWPDTPGRREAEAAWRELDAAPVPEPAAPVSAPPAASLPPPASEPPVAPVGDPSPVTPLLPPGRSALGAFDPGRRGIRVLAVVAVLVALVAGYLAWRSQPRAEPVPAAPSASTGSAPSTGQIIVAVQGRVAHPGLYRLPAGARVADALAAAGGALPGVDLSYVNLARKLSDGELVLVGTTPPPDQSAPGGAGGKVNLNTATVAQLDALPGVGSALAQRILAYRDQHGGFRSVDDLRHVPGIGDAKFAQLKDLVTV
jgi:competence protein ComEA